MGEIKLWNKGWTMSMKKIKGFIAGSFIVAGGVLSVPDAEARAPRQPAATRAAQRANVRTIRVNTARRLIRQRVRNATHRREVEAIAEKITRLRDPSIVGAWGLGCGAGCSSGRDWTTQSKAQRARAINAARIPAAKRRVLIDINSRIDKLTKRPGDLVGAWGLGCGGSCSRAPDQFGNRMARRR